MGTTWTPLFLFLRFVVPLHSQPDSNPDARVVLIASNRGRVGALFDNPFYSSQLAAWQMTREHAWTCAFHYLFPAPVPGVARRFQNEINTLSAPEPLKIGIMVRTGDSNWDVTSYDLAKAAAYFGCAEIIEESQRSTSTSVLWYLTSDHMGLRAAALHKVRCAQIASHEHCQLRRTIEICIR